MYTQKQSYELIKNGYHLSSKTIIVNKLHSNEPKITWCIQHIWKCKGKRKIFISDPNRQTTIIPESFIKVRTEEVLASHYFQMDDSSYSVQIRSLIKNYTPKLIQYLTEKGLLKLN